MMRIFLLFLVSMVSVSCSAFSTIDPGQVYSSPIGGLKCQVNAHFRTKVEQGFGPHGGTVRLIAEMEVTRIDIEEISPALPASLVSGPLLPEIHSKYLADSLMPLIRTGVPNASLLGQRSADMNGRHVYYSAVLFPGKSNLMYSDGKYADGIRAQAQYTNGKFMYVISILDHVRSNLTAESQFENNLARVTKAFGACSFPD